jgi:hypothetical protein
MKRLLIAACLAAAVAIGAAGSVGADPISCPDGQTATKTSDFWQCVNNGGNGDHSGDSSNPNGNPNFYR